MSELSRRKFIQLTVLGGATAAAGCKTLSRYDPVIYKSEVAGQYGGYDNRVQPYLNQPDGLMDGVPQYFATVCQMCAAGCGLYVRTVAGRAVQVQGNPAHPVNAGKTCARAHASLQHLYNPDRLRFPALQVGPKQPAQQTEWETALGRVTDKLKGARGQIAILADAVTFGSSPTQTRIIGDFAKSVGASVTYHSLLDDAPWRAAAKAVYGRDQVPAYQLDEADFILSFSSDFLEAWPSPVYYNRLFGDFRQGPRRQQGEHGKFVYIGPRMSMTAAKADKWIPCNPGTEGSVAQGILTALGQPGALSVAEAATQSGVTEAQINAIARRIGESKGRSIALGGASVGFAPGSVAALTAIELLNADSACVGFGTAGIAPGSGQHSYRQTQTLLAKMSSGAVKALLVIGQPNPAFTLPQAAGFAEAITRVPFVAALTPFTDDTTAHANVMLPIRTFLEDWGDSIPAVLPAGATVTTLRQPVIDPWFVGGHGNAGDKEAHTPWMDTRPLGELLIDMAKRLGLPLPYADTRAAVRQTWAGIGQADLNAVSTDNDTKWVAALSKGGAWKSAPPTPNNGGARTERLLNVPLAPPLLGAGGQSFSLLLYPHIYWTDGRHANLGWMQETPDPMTSAVWNSWVEINLETAHKLGIRTGDIIRIATANGAIEVPAVPTPGIHPQAVAMPLGQGHGEYGRNAQGRGTNPLALLDPQADPATGALAFGLSSVTLTKVRDAKAGYHGMETLVLAQDRPGGQEPDAVKDLIHTTAKEWKTAKPVTGAPQAAGSIFNRKSGAIKSN